MADTKSPPQSEDLTNNNQQPATVSDEKEKRESSSVNLSDVNRLIREISDAKKNLAPEPPAIISPEPSIRPPSFEQGEQAAQQGLSGAGRVGSRTAAQAGRVAAQAGRVAAQAAARGTMAILASPPGLIAVGVVILLLVTVFLIVFIKGQDKYSSETNAQETISTTPSPTAPTETPSPTISEEPAPTIPAQP